MSQPSGSEPQHGSDAGSFAEQLRLESDRLRELADKLKARETALAEMEANYPALLKYVYAKLRDDFKVDEQDQTPEDIEAMIREGKALPFESFIEDINKIVERR